MLSSPDCRPKAIEILNQSFLHDVKEPYLDRRSLVEHIRNQEAQITRIEKENASLKNYNDKMNKLIY